MTALFVTGSDTGVGKTFATCALAILLRGRGLRVGVMKPAETGVVDQPDDALRLMAASGDTAPLDDVCPYRFTHPLAPAMAARLEGRAIDVTRLTDLIRRRAAAVDVFLVEGAGGLLVPITETFTFLDLALASRLPTLVVAANRLGTINHTALTVRVAQAAGVDVVGFVLSHPTPTTDESAATNRDAIMHVTGVPCLGVLPHATEPSAVADQLTWPPSTRPAAPA